MRTHAAVAAGHPAVTEVAADVLRVGGNAFDGAVAAGFAAAVAEPGLSSLGGGGFLLARTHDGRCRLFDFFVETPGRGLPADRLEPHFVPITVPFPSYDQEFHVGAGSAAVPGCLAGYLEVHRRLGRLPLERLLAPCIALAREGLVLNRHQAYVLWLLRPILQASEEGRSLYAPAGTVLTEGEHFRNPPLADFLESLPERTRPPLQDDPLAKDLAAEMARQGGLISEEDLRAYRVVERDPLTARVRGRTFLTNPPPSFGGALVKLSLELLDGLGPPVAGADTASTLLHLAAVMRESHAARVQAQEASAHGDDLEVASARMERVRTFARGTTHVSVIDAQGNAAAMTTSNGEGSGVFIPGTGIMLNNMLGEDDLHPGGFHSSPPGERVGSMMAPSMVLEDDRLRHVLGSGGSQRIRTAIFQVVARLLDHDLSLAGAIEHPRIHWDGATLQIESGFPAAVVEELRERLPVNLWTTQDIYFGGVHAVSANGDAAADPRRGGAAVTL